MIGCMHIRLVDIVGAVGAMAIELAIHTAGTQQHATAAHYN